MSSCEKATVVWIIAGSDSSGGAGIQADLRTLQSFDVHGCTIITAITAQSPSRVSLVQPVGSRCISAQLSSLATELPPQAVKIGMLGSGEIVREVAAFLDHIDAPIILDPVLTSSSGTALLEERGIREMKERLFPGVSLLTPNLPEAEKLLGHTLDASSDIEQAGEEFLRMGAKSVLIKGGHLLSNRPSDLAQDYFTDGDRRFWLTSPRRYGPKARGTGCALSAALAAALAKNYSTEDAVALGKSYLNRAIRRATPLGEEASLLFQGPWPENTSPADLPVLTIRSELPETRAFPDCGQDPIGFYPIVNRTSWLRRLLPLGVTTAQLRIKDLQGEKLEEEIAGAIQYARLI